MLFLRWLSYVLSGLYSVRVVWVVFCIVLEVNRVFGFHPRLLTNRVVEDTEPIFVLIGRGSGYIMNLGFLEGVVLVTVTDGLFVPFLQVFDMRDRHSFLDPVFQEWVNIPDLFRHFSSAEFHFETEDVFTDVVGLIGVTRTREGGLTIVPVSLDGMRGDVFVVHFEVLPVDVNDEQVVLTRSFPHVRDDYRLSHYN